MEIIVTLVIQAVNSYNVLTIVLKQKDRNTQDPDYQESRCIKKSVYRLFFITGFNLDMSFYLPVNNTSYGIITFNNDE